MNMKRFLLTLVCCSPLVFSPSISFSLDLTGPNGEQALSYEQYGPISAVETLWGMSTKLRPDNSVSIQQTLVAIYKLNPYAFYKGNINKLIPESVIAVPTLEFIQGQTDKEASALIAKYSGKKQVQISEENLPPVAPAKESVIKEPVKKEAAEKPVTEIVQPEVAELVKDNLVDKKELIAVENKLDALKNELNIVNEQLVVATETNQSLKLKLKPLQDELSALTEQIESELLIHKKLQQIIDDYRAQLDAVAERPFSGEGLINEILRWITSSLINLLIVIISPILFLLTIFAVVIRIRSKHSLAQQEQELAESTAILMEESGQFDALLTEDLSNEPEQELDFTTDDSMVQDTGKEAPQAEAINIDDDETFTIAEESERIDLTDEDDAFAVVDLTEAEEPETSEDDPFGIGALAEEEDLISSVDLDDSEIQTSEDDPFGIGALVEEEDLISSVADSGTVSAEEQADLDLAAEWEAQLSEQSGDAEVKQNDVAEQDESSLDLTATSADIAPVIAESTENNETLSEIELSAIEELQADLPTEESELEFPELEISDIDEIVGLDLSESEESELEFPELDLTDLTELDESKAQSAELETAEIEELAELDLTDLTELDESKAQSAELETAEIEELAELDLTDLTELDESTALLAELETTEIDELAELDLTELAESTALSAELELTELDLTDLDDAALELDENVPFDASALDDLIAEQEPKEKLEKNGQDIFAKQLSDVAFNVDAPLPKVDSEQITDFIDIETLLENSDQLSKDEPYAELDLDLGLNEFPDVVNAEEGIDIDDDENGIGAQLDLARAYLEIDDQAGAKEILLSVLDDSNGAQRIEIDKLLSRLK